MKYVLTYALIFFTIFETCGQQNEYVGKYEQGFFETDNSFTKRVTQDYVRKYIRLGQLYCMFHGSISFQTNSPEYITSIGGLSFNIAIPSIEVDGDLTSISPLEFSIELYDELGIKIFETIIKTYLYNHKRSMGGVRLESGYIGRYIDGAYISNMDKRNLDEMMTLIVKLNGKNIFVRKDTFANFALGNSGLPKINGRYYMIRNGWVRSEEVKKLNKKYKFKLSY